MTTATLDRRSDRTESRPVRLANPVHAGRTSATGDPAPPVGGEYPVELARTDELFQTGYLAGRVWAADVASRDQLENLTHLADQLGDEAAGFFVYADKSPARSCDLFADTAGPALGGDAPGRRRLWRTIARDIQTARIWTRPEFVAGVFTGATDSWRAVVAEL